MFSLLAPLLGGGSGFVTPGGSSVKFTRSNCCGWKAVAVIFKVVTTLKKKITEP